MKILIADDDTLTHQMIETLLLKWGHDAGDGRRGGLPKRPRAS